MNLNIDSKTLEACLKTVNNIGSTTYKNICTGSESVVPWGNMDYFVLLIVIVSISMLIYFLASIGNR